MGYILAGLWRWVGEQDRAGWSAGSAPEIGQAAKPAFVALAAHLLTFGRVFKTKIRDGSEKLGLEEEIAETCRVNTDVGALLRCCRSLRQS